MAQGEQLTEFFVYPYTAGEYLGHFSTLKVAKNPGLVYGSVLLMVAKAPFGVCYDCYTSAVFG